MIDTWTIDLPQGITLSCRSAGERGRPLMMFLHGFPEAAFIWDELLEYFAQPEHGGFRCVAPNLRGFERSSAPREVEAYRPQLLTQDIEALAAAEGQGGRIETLVAHDWGGAFAWAYGNLHGDKLGRLVIINSPQTPLSYNMNPQKTKPKQIPTNFVIKLYHILNVTYQWIIYRMMIMIILYNG